MKLAKLTVITICISIFLSSCTSPLSAEDRMTNIRESICSCNRFEMRVNITADYGSKIFLYTLKYIGTDSDGSIEIIEPDSIAGLCANVSFDNGVKLEYDGAILDTGKLYEEGLSPVDAIPVMLLQWKHGYISECSAEKYGKEQCIAAVITISDEVSLRTWFEEDSYLPVHAEIMHNGFVIIACDFENILMN